MAHKEILDLLAARPGEYLSGEAISQQLNLTRAAVWKQIQALKAAGYEIEAQTKNGYRLKSKPLSLDQWAIERELKTQVLGRPLYLFDEVPSTNELAKEEIRHGGADGLVIISKRQSAGKGRLQRAWQSPEGGIWMSVVIRPNLTLAEAAKLTLSSSIAVVEALREVTELNVGIKWPNDLVVDGQKLAGILGEVVGEWTTIQTIVLGIGINANFARRELEDSIAATTLQELLGYETDLNQLVAKILEHLEGELHSLELNGFHYLRKRWLERAVGIGEEVVILREDGNFTGILQGISASGALVIQTEGQELEFNAGEVRLRAKEGSYF